MAAKVPVGGSAFKKALVASGVLGGGLVTGQAIVRDKKREKTLARYRKTYGDIPMIEELREAVIQEVKKLSPRELAILRNRLGDGAMQTLEKGRPGHTVLSTLEKRQGVNRDVIAQALERRRSK